MKPEAPNIHGLAECDSTGFSGPRIVALGFIIMNLAVGLTHGTFGPLVLPMVERFDSSVSVVSLGMSLIVSTSGLLALVIGIILNRLSIRAVMATGAILSATGYAILPLSTSITGALVSYGLFIGPGVALLGFLPCYTLISRWYIQGQGRAFGIIGLPFVVMVMPFIVTKLLPEFGFEAVVLLIAAGYLSALPFVWLVIGRPEEAGQSPRGKVALSTAGEEDIGRLSIMQIFRDPTFLLIVFATGLTMGPQVAKSVYLMPIVIERGFDVELAALLLSISGGAAILGSILFGALADRISAALTLMIVSGLQALSWVIVIGTSNFPLLVLDSVIMGACAGGFVAPKSVLISRIYGIRNYSLVMGASGLATLPFLFGMPPLIGVMREASDNYLLPVALLIAGLGIALLCFMWVWHRCSEMDLAGQSAKGSGSRQSPQTDACPSTRLL